MVISALPFLPALRYGFVYDDDVQVVDTVSIRSVQTPANYFFTSVWTLRNSAIPLNFNYYRPLFYSWLRVSAALFGVHPLPWHLAVLLTHLAVTVLVFFLLCRHLRDPWMAVAGSLVFGLHPVHIESVVWISGVTDPLAALGILGSFLLWLRKMETPRTGLLIGSLACYGAALMCKETAVVLPAIVFAYVLMGIPICENTSHGKPGNLKAALRETLPFLAITVSYLGLRMGVLHSFRAGSPAWLSRSGVLLTAPSVLLFYLGHLVWPAGLRLFYDFAPVFSFRSPQFWAPLAALAALAGGVLLEWRRWGAPVFAAAAWIVLPLLPVLNIGLFFKDDFLHDRYLYLPSVGLALFSGLAAQKIFGQEAGPARRIFGLSGFVLLFFLLGASTVIQAAPWQDNLSLYSHTAEHSTNTMARVNLASELSKRGQYDDAKTMLESVVRERPDFWLVNYDLGYVSYRLKDLDTAERLLRRAIALNPDDADSYEYLGLTSFRENRLDEAGALLTDAIARNSGGQGYHFALGVVLQRQGRLDAAKAEFAQEIRNHPDNTAIRAEVAQLEDNSGAQEPAAASTSSH